MGALVRTATVAVALLLSLVPGPAAADDDASPPRLPTSIAALGDSITRATNVCCLYDDHPARSWSTGSRARDGVYSHYERLAARQRAIVGNTHNFAASGARARHLPAQAAAAADKQPDYVTILIGANDLCTSSAATMTSTAAFARHVNSALATLQQRSPNAHIFVSSIPNIYRLWSVLRTNRLARHVWSTYRICPSMLASRKTKAQRQQVVARELAFNRILARTCARYANCRWDGGATYNYAFSSRQVSKLDYFHPGRRGQAALARITWRASYWAS